jgi:hypothetical protein
LNSEITEYAASIVALRGPPLAGTTFSDNSVSGLADEDEGSPAAAPAGLPASESVDRHGDCGKSP